MPRALLFLLLAACSALTAHAAHYRVVILAGQSNASGRANKSTLPASSSDASIRYFYDYDSTANSASRVTSAGLWETLRTRGDNFGPEMLLGRTLHAGGVTNLAIIKTSWGGTSLALDWQKGATSGRLMYSRLITNVNTALGLLTAAGDTYELAGFFWMQGESDTGANATAYETNLRAFVANIRSDLSAPRLPFVIGRIAATGASTNPADVLATVQAAQLAVAGSDQRIDWINTSDLALLADKLHFGPQGQIGLGTRFAQAFLAFDSLSSWRAKKFTAGQLADASVSGPDATPAGDGVPNLLKYHLGLDPFTRASAADLPAGTLSPAGDRLVLAYRRSRGAIGADGLVQFSSSLAADSWATASVSETVTGFTATHELVEASLPLADASRAFLRLRITATP